MNVVNEIECPMLNDTIKILIVADDDSIKDAHHSDLYTVCQ